VRQQRYDAACAVSAAMLLDGQAVFSPIVHSHPLVAYGLPTDWAFWQRVDGDHLLFCDKVVVLMLDGWVRSAGVREEVRIARELRKPVRYVEYGAAAQPRAVSPTLAHVAAGRERSAVRPTNERTPRRGERGASPARRDWRTDKATDSNHGARTSIHPAKNGDSVLLFNDWGEAIRARPTES
jgi:hypothetical protein